MCSQTAGTWRRAPLPAKFSANSTSESWGSTRVSGARSRPEVAGGRCGLVGNAVKPAASTRGIWLPEPAIATVWPVSASDLASGSRGSRCPAPPTKVRSARKPPGYLE